MDLILIIIVLLLLALFWAPRSRHFWVWLRRKPLELLEPKFLRTLTQLN